MNLRFYRIGSDPEFLFVKEVEWEQEIVPAHTIIYGSNSPDTSFIGLDGHSATAELRPPPSHNIKQQLLNIASGLVTVADWVKNSSSGKNISLIAWPYILEEPLGGHIHTSFFVEGKHIKWASEHNLTYLDRVVTLDYNAATELPYTDEERGILEWFVRDAENWQVPTKLVYAYTMNFLIEPFELWVQPWKARIYRNRRYSRAPTSLVRLGPSCAPDIPKYKDWTYYHYEYRCPSTWLQHPHVAYVYYALTKLILLNFDTVASLAREVVSERDPATRGKSGERFYKRLAQVRNHRLKITNDIKDLDMAVEEINKNRGVWFNPRGGININYWSALL